MKRGIVVGVLLIGLLTVSLTALAQNGDDFDLSWFTVDGGGGESSGGEFTLSATVGQPDASNILTGGEFALVGGFWSLAAAPGVEPAVSVRT